MMRWFARVSILSLLLVCANVAWAQVRFPIPGRPINIIVPFAPGGPTDAAARLLVPTLEKELGTQVVVVNKPGASTQVGVTQVAMSRPDGYTIGVVSLPQLATIYMDPERKAVFARKDLQPLAVHVVDPVVIVVRHDSPFNNLKDLIDAAKANPNKLKGGDGGYMGINHLAWLDVARQTGVVTGTVHFNGVVESSAALLGGHIDFQNDTVAGSYHRIKSGELRALGIMDAQESPFLPGVKTFASQGFQMNHAVSRGLIAPAGTPKEVVDKLSAAIKKAMNDEDHKKRMIEMGQTLRYMDPTEFASYWQEQETRVKPLMDLAKADVTKN